MYEIFFNVYESHKLKMFQISYLYLWRNVIKMFNWRSLSDTLWLAYIMLTFQPEHIIRDQNCFRAECEHFLKTICYKGRPSIGPHYAEAAFMKALLFLFSHIRISHIKKYGMLLMYNGKFHNYSPEKKKNVKNI